MVLTKIRLAAVVEIDEKHANKIARLFNDLLDSLPDRIANVAVLERTAETEKPDGKQVSRTGRRDRQGADGLQP